MAFSPELREKLLLWCDRHCCLCKRVCDVFIEVHHIVPVGAGGADDEENAMPLCFDCHAKVSHYDSAQPLGTKFKPSELKQRRDQVYDEFTRHLVPALSYEIQRVGRELPDVGFQVKHPGQAPSVQLHVRLDTYLNGEVISAPGDPLYQGKMRWNLNPNEGVNGHFHVPADACKLGVDLRVGVNVTIYDVYDRPHKLLPVTYVYSGGIKLWWLDPVDPAQIRSRIGGAG